MGVAGLAGRLSEAAYLVSDVGAELASYVQSVDSDPARLATVQERRERFAKSIDGQLPTPEQLCLLGRMAADALVEIRARSREPELVFALADAFHCLPAVMHELWFSWSYLLIFLVALEREFPEVGRRYIAAFDQVVGFKAEADPAADGGGM